MPSDPIHILRGAGISNPLRVARLIHDTVKTLKLDLRGLTVLTEAASGPFVVTPVIAAAAGAERIIALTRNSGYASVVDVITQTRGMASICGVGKNIEIHSRRAGHFFNAADIVTNLGFVRPLDRKTISNMRSGSVISLMCEAWELRSDDIDITACRAQNVRVVATNESTPSLNIFAYSGWLCIKLLLGAGIEVNRDRILIVSSDKFGITIQKLLARAGVQCTLTHRLSLAQAKHADAIVVADYSRNNQIIGNAGDVKSSDLAAVAPSVTVVQFAGQVDVIDLKRRGIAVYPGIDLPHRRMALTLGGLGARPVIELHAAGLKVGQLALEAARRKKKSPFKTLSQPVA